MLCQYMSRLVTSLSVLPCSLESPDPTFTVENVVREIQKVAVDNRRQLWENVFGYDRVIGEIYDSQSSDEEKLCSVSDIYVNCRPDSSWEELVCCLYENGEMAAAEITKAFLPPKGKQSMHSTCTLNAHNETSNIWASIHNCTHNHCSECNKCMQCFIDL